ncbi:hypothetical protein MIND_01049900 [Mycena indigotica]|uniref:Mog1p/PsbP-like protein n=1 Tax=Mycena indigotica TaxID=2126181 RepID=A0A8H6S8T7_9AGAR|nr:uncharacterized protein MIND_01049900 [Mycena indigotica]KAF7295115.1 hypothetical protein MIND_01049900 [Mycena indigotica]
MSTIIRDLFGGAIKAVLPSNLVDASDFRQIPDNQEVFLYPDSNVSIIVEVLQRVDAQDDDSAIRFHFDSLAHDNSAETALVEAVATLTNTRGDKTPSAITLVGIQTVAKFNKSAGDRIRILMALYRIPDKLVDLVVTFNIPIQALDSVDVTEEGWKTTQSHFDGLVRSLSIVDFGLFV